MGTSYGWTESIPEGLVVLSAVRVVWAADPEAQYMVQYKHSYLPDFTNASPWLTPVNGEAVTYIYPNSLTYIPQEYRILVKGGNGLFNTKFASLTLDPVT